MTAPLRVDSSTTLSDSTDFEQLVRERLSGRTVFSANDVTPMEPFERLYRAANGTPYAARLSRAVASALRDADPLVRGMAAMFFQLFPDADGAEQVVDVAMNNRALFAGVPRPWSPGADLDRELMRAVSARAQRGDARARSLAYSEVLRPGKAMPLIGALTESDPTWVATHAEEIVRATPAAAKAILFNLQGSSVDVGDVGERIAPIAMGADSSFADDLESYVSDRATRDRIMEAARKAESAQG